MNRRAFLKSVMAAAIALCWPSVARSAKPFKAEEPPARSRGFVFPLCFPVTFTDEQPAYYLPLVYR